MDDSHEVIINTTPSRDIEGDQDSTLPLNDSFIELNVENRNTRMSDPKEQIKSRNIQLDNIFDEVNELKGIFKDAWEDICNDFTQCRQEFASKFEHLTNKVNTDIVDIKGRINAIDQIIEQNKVTIKEASDALKRSKEEKRVVSDELSHTQEIDNKFKSNTLLEQTHFNTNTKSTENVTKSTENVNHNSIDLDRHLVPRDSPPVVNCKNNRNISMKPQLYDGDDDLNEYLAQFEILAEINNWDYITKSLYLAGSLKGGARALLNELDRDQRRDYDSLVRVLNNRYGSAERSELYRAKLQTRIRGKDETLPELAQSIKKLTRLAYPIAHSTLISVLSLEHFIDAIPDGDIRLRLREVNPKNINEAETLAVRLETLKLADRQKGRMIRKVGEQAPDLNPVKINNSEDNIKHLKDNFQELKKEMSSFTKEIRDMVQNRLGNTGYIGEVKRNNPQSSNNYQHYQNRQTRNNGKFNRNWGNSTNNNFNRNYDQNTMNQGNQWRSGSGARARHLQEGPRQ